MPKKINKETRFFIDIDLATKTVLGWDYDDRKELIKERPAKPGHHRVYITPGQYNKLIEKADGLK